MHARQGTEGRGAERWKEPNTRGNGTSARTDVSTGHGSFLPKCVGWRITGNSQRKRILACTNAVVASYPSEKE